MHRTSCCSFGYEPDSAWVACQLQHSSTSLSAKQNQPNCLASKEVPYCVWYLPGSSGFIASDRGTGLWITPVGNIFRYHLIAPDYRKLPFLLIYRRIIQWLWVWILTHTSVSSTFGEESNGKAFVKAHFPKNWDSYPWLLPICALSMQHCKLLRDSKALFWVRVEVKSKE